MKKKELFLITLIAISVLLFMLRATGMMAHITLSVVGLLVLIVYTLTTKKEWKCKILEIAERVFYGIALITGAVLMNVHGILVLSVVHKISAGLFALLLIVNEIQKSVKK